MRPVNSNCPDMGHHCRTVGRRRRRQQRFLLGEDSIKLLVRKFYLQPPPPPSVSQNNKGSELSWEATCSKFKTILLFKKGWKKKAKLKPENKRFDNGFLVFIPSLSGVPI